MIISTAKSTAVLRWSGSKAKLIPELLRRTPRTFNRYYEPFAGSARLFFELQPKRAVLGDLNKCVIDVYRAIRSDWVGVADALDSIPRTSEAFYLLRSIHPESLDLSHRAARLIFMMKACFNGVYRTNKSGVFNVPMGNRIYSLPTRDDLRITSLNLTNAVLIDGSFHTTVAECTEGDLVYMDPPYRGVGRYRGEYGYANGFSESHFSSFVTTAIALAKKQVNVMISYQYDEGLVSALPGWYSHPVYARRTISAKASTRGNAKELIITSYPI
ncbi:DNA adenine methylase [Achromobacter dolens]|uniref:DNA adenine methylase n=1 Tax=Achromobacter dolens TaxID=1287738 RepID=UPI003B99F3FB